MGRVVPVSLEQATYPMVHLPFDNPKISTNMKRRTNPPIKTTQDVIESYFREEYRIAGFSSEDTEKMIADFRQKFGGRHNHPPHPELLAMLEAELRESEDFVRRLE